MAPKKTTIPPSVFATAQLSLLATEQASEVAETTLLLSDTPPTILAQSGLAVLNLALQSQRTGLGGKTVVELGLDTAIAGANADLPKHGIRTGDIVRLGNQPKGDAKKKERSDAKAKGVEGVVTRVGERAIWVALGTGGSGDDDVDLPAGKLWLVKLANDVTYKRINQVMTKMSKMTESEFSSLTRVLFGLSSPSPPDLTSAKDIDFIDPSLNDSQKQAIRFALASSEVALIHGPPGTGKTHTLIELILQMLKRGLRILVCGPSNISVDNIVERLAPHKVPIVRLGHPARLLPSVLNHSLEVLTRTSEAAAIVQDVRKEMDQKQASIRKTRNGRERKAIYGELKELRKEYRQREGKCVDNLVQGSKVVLATLHGAGGHQLKNQEFDVVIIDEASQALEAQCWVPLLSAKKAVLAGDHLQLPPTVKSSNVKTQQTPNSGTDNSLDEELKKLSLTAEEIQATKFLNLEHTMFDRLLTLHGPSIKTLLNVQYRMHEKIMRFPSDELYDGKLIAAEHVKSRLLKDLEYDISDTEDTREPLVFYDTQGGDFPEKTEDDATPKTKRSLLCDSKSNEMEASLVAMHVRNLISAGVHPEDVAVITPYNAQLSLLSSLLKERYPGLELGSVDGFQGREKEAVIVSLVRSNPEHEVGFLGEKRRLNVAMTRPKRHLCIVGDSETVGRGSKFLKNWMKFLEDEADLRYPNLDDLQGD
ncbi:putative dna helicase [Phaeomoniella chlamydospora]|uniref:DNA helicase n=1 Tax=Phaeomoniella chlamydospora TaxID=158046 RepID=A0A0G2EQP8_PHACM|nr:putative dna helicase [Phaeomoniella chlamydospora]